MKYFIYFLMLFAVAMMVLSLSLINFDNLLGEESQFGSISFMASLIVLVLLIVLLASKKVKEKYNEQLQDKTH
ncbi:hypothetical protein [Psychroflexus planctonicus]|uniref:Uncharacterized protein n=1 Tax=Psychroflexus planctonicus TaxID=1526575 RepID=A0ABQ1SE47_9FLAO|nr:hypothetical protein [Psychroflexus planctonicus]GGE25349.1 hypothetical protein GCM10010832_02610 [Psychroflexus planctonicus]